jgi:predicted nucleic acid-binding protein
VTYLLDTNVVSELRKASCHPNVRAWFDSVRGRDKYLSVLVIGELTRGIERVSLRNDHRQAADLQDWVNSIAQQFSSRIAPISMDVALTWGRLLAHHSVPHVDGLLAATALQHGWIFVTRNTKDVERTGVRLLNPFEAQPN